MTSGTASAACDGWDGSECEGTPHCPPRCPRFVDKEGARWTIRPATDADEPFLAEMYERFGRPHRAQGLPPVSRRRRVDWIRSMLSEGNNVVAERDGELFGHAMYTPTDADTPELAVFVHPDAQDRGVGTELCRHVIANAAAAGRDGIELHVETGNRPARSVYRTVGFEVVERRGDLRMRVDLDQPIATEVRWPPLAREGPAEPAVDLSPTDGGPERSPADD
ncbi:GNAT family N-acetyltransferase [Halorubrum ezzemoulense]|uniref:GNAT family N-acetyltransferase n=1 Tax=Halorubrum ezzemoulense TaxID=337243 RepID=A0A256KBV1_HALEZ|nr:MULTISPECIES: GNAT family N-acetyltransferase [Halorubrum]MDB2245375.1 GNAT family N-acetyltransferase [Halorubrum ezzemoulense]MDB2250261.1 GNAT family N-acetyltransferase [Halorubrum ezzemoulense]MDB2262634.1 GNAT family N-acetyltransferase [Halorubrum ezzemoulense]MDB2270746.1 GNAT family N-acetyltransferase [Halorubrum ezzemoulense]MDB2279247.1 GNAT family N-acetyltransferase [Halorubrum ezzemoulense]